MQPVYQHSEEVHNLKAPSEVVPLILEMLKPVSVLDVGCGIGTWLHMFEREGVRDYIGVDGDYINKSLLKIPPEKFLAHDLTKRFNLGRKFDLVISLEVAEHLPETCADTFVESLISHGNVIVFSAALPGQSGQNHLNENWPEYWAEKFAKYGFFFHDVIRPKIWQNEKIDWWYRQNMFLVSKEKPETTQVLPQSIVHPKLLEQKIKDAEELHDSLITGKQGLRISTRIFINAFVFKLTQLFGGNKK